MENNQTFEKRCTVIQLFGTFEKGFACFWPQGAGEVQHRKKEPGACGDVYTMFLVQNCEPGAFDVYTVFGPKLCVYIDLYIDLYIDFCIDFDIQKHCFLY